MQGPTPGPPTPGSRRFDPGTGAVFSQWSVALGISFFLSFSHVPTKIELLPLFINPWSLVLCGGHRESQCLCAGRGRLWSRPWDSGGLGRHLGAARCLQGGPPAGDICPLEPGAVAEEVGW